MDSHEEERLEKAMPWVGGYIAAASAVCALAMAADAFNGFRLKKLWFPCTYFSLNPTILTLLGVAMKLAMDLTAVMKNIRIAKFTSLIFMSTAMGNFMSSLGSMNDKHILANVVALTILVITVIADVLIRFIMLKLINFYIAPLILMLLSLATLISVAITVPATKIRLEMMYREKHKSALSEEGFLQRREALRIDERKRYMMKYWVMAETSNPQFVMARSVVCTTSALICLISLITLPIAYILIWKKNEGSSVYGSSVEWILYTQTVGVAVGTIAPMLRWLVVVTFKCSTTNTTTMRERVKIESYWIQTLVEMRESFSSFQIMQGKFRKFLHDAKWFAITFCIWVQILIVLLSKLFVFLSALFMSPFFFCFTHHRSSSHEKDLNLCRFVLLLEGESELPRTVLKNICSEADNMIEIGRRKQPQCLINLVSKFVDFKGVGGFDRSQIPRLNSQEPANNWALPVVTLTSIAIAVPHIAEKKKKQLLSSVSHGLSLAKLVEKTLIKDEKRVNIREAADMCWVGVLLYMKWLDIDLIKSSYNSNSSKEMLQELSGKAQRIVIEHFNKKVMSPVTQDPLNWPAHVVAANSMYRVSRTVLLSIDEENGSSDEVVFEQVNVMIADILAACFTCLPNLITTMCHRQAIEEREESVRKAFLLLGKTEQIVEVLQQQEWPSMDPDTAADIEEWRALYRHNESVATTMASISSCETVVASI